MKLTIKNIIKELEKEQQCHMCGADTEMVACNNNKDGKNIYLFCIECGANANLYDFLLELDKK